jgi:hypothetical protein
VQVIINTYMYNKGIWPLLDVFIYADDILHGNIEHFLSKYCYST